MGAWTHPTEIARTIAMQSIAGKNCGEHVWRVQTLPIENPFSGGVNGGFLDVIRGLQAHATEASALGTFCAVCHPMGRVEIPKRASAGKADSLRELGKRCLMLALLATVATSVELSILRQFNHFC
jgi:hypothetical protein